MHSIASPTSASICVQSNAADWLAGGGASGRPASAGTQPGQHGYEAEVLREQDSAVSEHLAQLEALAASMQDPAAAQSLRAHATELRRVSSYPICVDVHAYVQDCQCFCSVIISDTLQSIVVAAKPDLVRLHQP